MGGVIARLLYFNNIRRKRPYRHTGLLVFLRKKPGRPTHFESDSVRMWEADDEDDQPQRVRF